MDVVEALGVLEVARGTDFGGQFDALAVVEGEGLIAGPEVDGDADGGIGVEIESELFAGGGEDGRIGDAAAEEDGFAIVGIELGSAGLAMRDFDGASDDD